jgi:ribonuclease HI
MSHSVAQLLAQIEDLSQDERGQLFDQLTKTYQFPSPNQVPQQKLPLSTPEEALGKQTDYVIIFDGGSKGNPGPGYGSYALRRSSDGKEQIVRIDFEREMTNNEAEYESLIEALRGLIERIERADRSPEDFDLEVRGDSALVLNQVRGNWKAKDDRMRDLRDQARILLSRFKDWQLVHHDREESVRILGH